MKIFFVIDSLGLGGAEKSTVLLINYLFNKGNDVSVYILDELKDNISYSLYKNDIEIKRVGGTNIYSRISFLKNQIRRKKPDIVHSVLFRSNILVRACKLAIKFRHIESIVSNTYSLERFRDSNVNKFTLLIYQGVDFLTANFFVDHFHAISKDVKYHYEKKLRINSNKISVIYRGRDTCVYKRRVASNHHTFKILNIGRQEYPKGQIYLLQAFKMLINQGHNIYLTILGHAGNESQKIKDYIDTNHLSNKVTIIDYDPNVNTYLMKSDLFVFPSLYEGLGGALIEAQAAGLPIACNDIPVLREVVVVNKNARLFSTRNIKTIAEAILFFIENPIIRESYALASLENYKAKFTLDINHEKMLCLYQSLIL